MTNLEAGDTPPPVYAAAGGEDATLPRCLRCDYIVVGLTSARCPECGTLIDWEAVERQRAARLPIDAARGWWKMVGGVQTWLLVLFCPRRFAKLMNEGAAILPATLFALTCMAIGILGNGLAGWEQMEPAQMVAWAIGVWFHIECQSLVFFLLDFRATAALRWWSFWRQVSLYTTAFVVMDWLAGPPVLYDNCRESNFPWLLNVDEWKHTLSDGPSLLRGVAYYWWMVVLSIVLWIRLRRKWVLLFILAAMPWITMVSCHVGAEATELLGLS